jgi:Ca-activated chloride channel family protein
MNTGHRIELPLRRIKFASISLIVFSLLLVFAAIGSSNTRASDQEPQTIIRTEVGLVNINFTVIDKNGRPVRGLKADDFQVFDNKVPQKIEYFFEYASKGKGTEVPLTIALLIDTSASVKNKLEFEKATAAEFFQDILRPKKDLALIIQFDSEVNLVQDFTQNHNDLLDALESLKAGNSTAFYDAVFLAADEKLKEETGRKVMVVITDGDDTSSKVSKEEAIEAAQRGDVLIYGIGVQTEDSTFRALKKFAEETGGAFFSPHATKSEIRDAFRSIGEDIQGQYSLAYSLNSRKDGSYHSIEIRSKVSGVKVRARKGYYVPKAASSDPE